MTFKLWQWRRKVRAAGASPPQPLKILTAPDGRLLVRSRVIHSITAKIQRLAEGMVLALHAAQGLGLAAPQVGHAVRLVVIDLGEGPRILLNPAIKAHEGVCIIEEGCLSVPNVIRRKARWHRVTYRAFGLDGVRIEETVEGLFAYVLQHEIDHLNGVLLA